MSVFHVLAFMLFGVALYYFRVSVFHVRCLYYAALLLAQPEFQRGILLPVFWLYNLVCSLAIGIAICSNVPVGYP